MSPSPYLFRFSVLAATAAVGIALLSGLTRHRSALDLAAVRSLGPSLRYETVDILTDRWTLPSGAVLENQAEVNVFRASTAELAAGRILGRIINVSPVFSPEYSLAPADTAYVYTMSDAAGITRIAAAVPTRPTPLILGLLELMRHPGVLWHQAMARWRTTSSGTGGPWFTCASNACCKTN